jgi:hypothetical protein
MEKYSSMKNSKRFFLKMAYEIDNFGKSNVSFLDEIKIIEY